MNPLVSALFLAALLSGPALAQQKTDEHAGHHAASPATAASSAELSDGEIRKIDRDAGKLTLKHGEIKNLDMPGMTMVFRVKETALLDKVKVGDKVKFRAEKVGGAYVVTVIEATN